MRETVDQINLAATHALRRGPGGEEPQITREADTAWRRDIDRELHLHYWERADGSVELAAVVPHNVFDIPRGEQ
jgi:hypothetical protein